MISAGSSHNAKADKSSYESFCRYRSRQFPAYLALSELAEPRNQRTLSRITLDCDFTAASGDRLAIQRTSRTLMP
jgi:hypothetical protein